ncbi:uncharacterized protein ARMOST_19651 [Armillaria ostoyae]|uniref:NADP-dependent oxidoreductase domain-containing protein n=1 Tax=Armillaria ostoyae TaxID=47428 RepID=A0A284S548_ARMOS|nr:uncharacterized protein ARMOST_19651 [Armillaria ostoyae]
MPTVLKRKFVNVSVPAIGFGAIGLSVGAAFEAGGARSGIPLMRILIQKTSSGNNMQLKLNPGKRDSIFLATKFGFTMQGARGDAEDVKQQCYTSLKRLGMDYIYRHRVDSNTPIERPWPNLSSKFVFPKSEILYRVWSSSIRPISALQIEYSPFILAHPNCSPTDFRLTIPKFKAENFPKILSFVDRIGDVEKRHNVTSEQAALAWILAQKGGFLRHPRDGEDQGC